ncbi:MAG: glutathione S-transferase family protein [Alphaproteobacteria bacterium]
MADVTLYGLALSTYTRTVRLALEEKGVAYTLQPVELRSPAHLAVQPFGKIPALRHGNVHLFETPAMLGYIDAAFPGPTLTPAGTMDRVHADQYASIFNDYLYASAIKSFVLPMVFPRGADGKPDMAVVEAGRAQTAGHLAIVDAMLAGTAGTYMVGDAFTAADMYALPILFWVERMPGGEALLSGAPRVSACYRVASARASAAATVPPMPQAA